MKLYQHQIDALNQTEDYNRCAYYLDMGLGKTFVGAEKMMQLDTKLDSSKSILICQKSKINDWIEHFKIYYPDAWVYNLTNKTDLGIFIASDSSSHHVGIINYDLCFRRPEIAKLHINTLMLDESSMITNPTAKRTKFIHKMITDNCILLSGTPTGGKYEKLWSQLKLLGWNITKDLFYKHYIIIDWLDDPSGFRIPIILGYKNVDRLKQKLKDHGCIFMKTEEVFDLPEQTFQQIQVPTSVYYKQYAKNDIVELNDGTELIGDSKLTKLLYARQLCGQYNDEKWSAFTELIQSTEDRVVVFYNFNNELNRLKSICENEKRPISIVNGHTKNLEAYENENDSVTLVQYQAGAMGLNLQKANKMIYFTLPISSDLFEQSKKRIHRIGQNKPCFYYYLICKNSVEEHILSTLKMRKDYDDELFIKFKEECK